MLKDWLWALLITFCLWLEVAGWARLLTRTLLPSLGRAKLGSRVTLALGFAATAQSYFVLSLIGRGSSLAHLALMITGIVLALLPTRGKTKHLHLKLARFFSPMSWRRAWPWLLLPVLWTGLRATDALVPHNDQASLAYHLFAPRDWFESGRQILHPLHPTAAIASIWEGLYFHLVAIFDAISPVHRTGLLRTQLTAQLVHLSAGQVLTIALLAKLITPFVRLGWHHLVHSANSAQRRHQLGMASLVAAPSSIFFAWLACGQTAVTSTLARNEWGATMFIAAALVLATERQILAAFFLGATALAANPDAGVGVVGLVTVFGYQLFSERTSPLNAQVKPARAKSSRWLMPARQVALGLIAGSAPWLWRNFTQAGSLVYWRSGFLGAGPGWLNEMVSTTSGDNEWSLFAKFFVVAGLPCIAVYLWRARLRVPDRAMAALIVFCATTGVVCLVSAPSTALVVSTQVLLAALGLEFLVTGVARPYFEGVARWVPHTWLAIGLFAVPMPFHLLWQNLPLMFQPAQTYLTRYHRHFEAKHWSSVHLPPHARIAWTSDTEFYYLEQPAVSIRESAIVHDALLRATNPTERARMLCELGFDVLAWEDRHHGPETAGLASWLRLNKTGVLHSSEGVTLLDLRCHQT